MPSELKQSRDWRMRQDPFEEDWPELAKRLAEASELEAKTLLEELLARAPERYQPGQLGTLQRRRSATPATGTSGAERGPVSESQPGATCWPAPGLGADRPELPKEGRPAC